MRRSKIPCVYGFVIVFFATPGVAGDVASGEMAVSVDAEGESPASRAPLMRRSNQRKALVASHRMQQIVESSGSVVREDVDLDDEALHDNKVEAPHRYTHSETHLKFNSSSARVASDEQIDKEYEEHRYEERGIEHERVANLDGEDDEEEVGGMHMDAFGNEVDELGNVVASNESEAHVSLSQEESEFEALEEQKYHRLDTADFAEVGENMTEENESIGPPRYKASPEEEESDIPVDPEGHEDPQRLHLMEPGLFEANFEMTKGSCKDFKTRLKRDEGQHVKNLKVHQVACPGGSALRAYRIKRGLNINSMQITYRCCAYAEKLGSAFKRYTGWRNWNNGLATTLKYQHMSCPDSVLTNFVLENSGSSVRFRYYCAKPTGQSEALTACAYVYTSWKDHGDQKMGQLKYHVPICDQHTTMTGTLLQHSSNKFRIRSRCCSIGKDVKLGVTRACSWSGDPHWCPFDRCHCNNHQLWSGRYVIVDSPLVKVQGFYCSRFKSENKGREWAHHWWHRGKGACTSGCCFAPAVTRGVAFGGHFLLGHILFLEDRLRGVWWDKKQMLKYNWDNVYPSGHRRRHYHKGQVEEMTEGLVRMWRHNYWTWTFYMPIGISITLNVWYNWWWGPYMDVGALRMRQWPAGTTQTGQCGNNNGRCEWSNERPGVVSSARWKTPASINLWGKDNQASPAKLAACAKGTEKYNKAYNQCKKSLKDTTSDAGKGFLKMCIYDVCVAGGGNFAKAAKDNEEAFEEADDDEKPLGFAVLIRSTVTLSGAQLSNPCGGQKLAQPHSQEENEYVMVVIAGAKDTTTQVRLGGQYNTKTKRWEFEGEPICQYSNFAPGKDKPVDSVGALCINKDTGLWEACSATVKLSTLCLPAKDAFDQKMKYAISESVGPELARRVCGLSHRLAMPKSPTEIKAFQNFLKEELDNNEKVWIGGLAAYYPQNFVWDDMTDLTCGSKSFWASGHPGNGFKADAAQGNTQISYMCAGKDGKFYNCGVKANTQRRAICEKDVKDRACPVPGHGPDFNSAYYGDNAEAEEVSDVQARRARQRVEYARRLVVAKARRDEHRRAWEERHGKPQGAPASKDSDTKYSNYTDMYNATKNVRPGEGEYAEEGVYHAGHCWYLGWEFDDCSNVCYAQLGTMPDEAGAMLSSFRYDVCLAVAKKLGLTYKPLPEGVHPVSKTDGGSGCHFYDDGKGQVMISVQHTFMEPQKHGCCQRSPQNFVSGGEAQEKCGKRSGWWNPYADYDSSLKMCLMANPSSQVPSGPKRQRICACSTRKAREFKSNDVVPVVQG